MFTSPEIFYRDTAVHTYGDDKTAGESPGDEIWIDVEKEFNIHYVKGGKVRISLPGKTTYLNLREVQVLARPIILKMSCSVSERSRYRTV